MPEPEAHNIGLQWLKSDCE